MLDKSINSALLALRKQIIRSDGGGLTHVEALLAIRGVEMPIILPAKRSDVAKHGQMRRWLLDELREGPKPHGVLVAAIMLRKPDVPLARMKKRVSVVLWKMRLNGMVRNEARKWWLIKPRAANNLSNCATQARPSH